MVVVQLAEILTPEIRGSNPDIAIKYFESNYDPEKTKIKKKRLGMAH